MTMRNLGKKNRISIVARATLLAALIGAGPTQLTFAEPLEDTRPPEETFTIQAEFVSLLYQLSNISDYREFSVYLLSRMRSMSPQEALAGMSKLMEETRSKGRYLDGLEPAVLSFWEIVRLKGTAEDREAARALILDVPNHFRFSELGNYMMLASNPSTLVLIDMPAQSMRDLIGDLASQLEVELNPTFGDLIVRHNPCVRQGLDGLIPDAEIGGALGLTRGDGDGDGAAGCHASQPGLGGLSACVDAAGLRQALTRRDGTNWQQISDMETCMGPAIAGATNPFAGAGAGAVGGASIVAAKDIIIEAMRQNGASKDRLNELKMKELDVVTRAALAFFEHNARMEEMESREDRADARAAEERASRLENTITVINLAMKLLDDATEAGDFTKQVGMDLSERALDLLDQASADEAESTNTAAGTPESRSAAAQRAREKKALAVELLEKAVKFFHESKQQDEKARAAVALLESVSKTQDLPSDRSRPSNEVQRACERLFSAPGQSSGASIESERGEDPRVTDPAPDQANDNGGLVSIAGFGICGEDGRSEYYAEHSCAASRVMMCNEGQQCGCSRIHEDEARALAVRRAAARCGMAMRCSDGTTPSAGASGFCSCEGGSVHSERGPVPLPSDSRLDLMMLGYPVSGDLNSLGRWVFGRME